jgi:hypothetical protein
MDSGAHHCACGDRMHALFADFRASARTAKLQVMRALLLLVTLVLLLGATCEEGTDLPTDKLFVVRGRLSQEGIECPTLRDRNGVLYSLSGSLGDYKHGDWVCVKGRKLEESECQKGTTLSVEWIGLYRWCQ